MSSWGEKGPVSAGIGADQVAGAAAVVAGAAHLLLAPSQAGDGPLWGLAFAAAGSVLVAAGMRLLASGSAWARRLVAASCAATAVAFAAVHVVGIPGHHHHHGPDGVGLLVTALEVVAVAVVLRAGPGRIQLPRTTAALVAATLATSTVALAAPSDGRRPVGCIEPTRHTNLYAEEITEPGGPIRLGYGLTPATATSPGPVIEMIEGECLAVTLTNNVPETTLQALRDRFPASPGEEPTPIGVSLHVHGVKYTTDSDGTVHTGSWVPPGESRTYTWYAAPRLTVDDRVVSLGTAGYWWYHDHIAGTTHGTGGLEAGLFGGMVVRRPGDPKPDRQYTVALGPTPNINMQHFPDVFTCDQAEVAANTCFVADAGERVEFLAFTVGNDFHTFHLHGHNWADNRTGMLTSQLDEAQLIDAKTVGPSESFGFQVVAGESVGPGDWMLHCHVQSHSDQGMLTFFRVRDAGGISVGTTGLQGHSHPASAPTGLAGSHGDHDH